IESNHFEQGPAPNKNAVSVSVDNDGKVYQVSGVVQGTSPLLCDINGAMFVTGVPLAGNVLFYKSTNALLPVTSALSGKAQVMSFSSSQGGENWNAMHIAEPLKDLDAVKGHVDFVTQISL
ncbi:D-3-phosphoglycerate dehydrogenase-like, partial [Saccoglossus kowalevskii]